VIFVIYRWFDVFLCALIFFVVVYAWGRFKRFIALRKLGDARSALRCADYREAVRICRGIAGDVQREPEFWYVFAVALAGAGSPDDAGHALKTLLELAPGHSKGKELMEAIRPSRGE
jgi:hypothetical protein